MGLMDVLNGMRNGPHGQIGTTGTSGGMSPLTMGLLALLAYKSFKGGGVLGGAAPQPNAPGGPGRMSDGSGDWLGGLGNLISGGAAGGILSGGIGELLKKFQQTGQGHVAQSWVGNGPNEAITPGELEKAVGADTLDALSRQSGMPRDQLLAHLSEQLPQTVDKMTPQGRVPDEQEAARWI